MIELGNLYSQQGSLVDASCSLHFSPQPYLVLEDRKNCLCGGLFVSHFQDQVVGFLFYGGSIPQMNVASCVLMDVPFFNAVQF